MEGWDNLCRVLASVKSVHGRLRQEGPIRSSLAADV